MLQSIHPKLPMRHKAKTKAYYIDALGFIQIGSDAHPDYLMVAKDHIEVHFFLYEGLDPSQNYGQVYIRTNDIDEVYASMQKRNVEIHPNAPLQSKPWGMKEFSLLDPDMNLLTFGQEI